MRTAFRDHTKLASTFGYCPRFLHSAGQLHKGDPNKGMFLQIAQDHDEDPSIPRTSYGFATLNQAQYLDDYQSLENHGRRLLRVHLHGDTDTRHQCPETIPGRHHRKMRSEVGEVRREDLNESPGAPFPYPAFLVFNQLRHRSAK